MTLSNDKNSKSNVDKSTKDPEFYNYPGFKINLHIARDTTSTML